MNLTTPRRAPGGGRVYLSTPKFTLGRLGLIGSLMLAWVHLGSPSGRGVHSRSHGFTGVGIEVIRIRVSSLVNG